MNQDPQSRLDEELGQLSRDVLPPANLWPAIARELRRSPQRAPWLAYAAALVCVCTATAAIVIVLHSRALPPLSAGSPPSVRAPAAVGASVAAAVFDEPQDANYQAARAALEHTYQERIALLDPDTRAQIESNLAQIRAARADLRAALARDPDSPLLQHLLESAWHEEFDMYDDIVRSTQPMLARS